MFTLWRATLGFPALAGVIRLVRACQPEGVWDDLPISDPRHVFSRLQQSRIFIFMLAANSLSLGSVSKTDVETVLVFLDYTDAMATNAVGFSS